MGNRDRCRGAYHPCVSHGDRQLNHERRPTVTPIVTVSLVTWNGSRWLPGCLGSVMDQDIGSVGEAIELLVVDNGSTDGTLAWLREHLPPTARDALVASPANRGYAPAHDDNVARAAGRAVLLLNQDVELHPSFLRHALEALDARPRAASVQGRVLRLAGPGVPSTILDTTGLLMDRDRRARSRAQGQTDGPEHAAPGPVWGADGPVPMYRTAALRGARLPAHGGGTEVLDRSFVAYKEDVDLAWRLRRLGWTAHYEPSAVAWHARGDSPTAPGDLAGLRAVRARVPTAVKMASWRNQHWMQLKNDPASAVLRDLLPIATREIASLGFLLLFDRGVLRAVPPTIRGLPDAWRKRRALRRLIRSGGARPVDPMR